MPRTPDFLKYKTIPDLIADTRRPKVEPDTAWYRVGASEDYEIPFQNSWANVGGSGIPAAAFYLDESGTVIMKGKVDGGAEGTTIFTLPVEYRPEHYEPFVVKMDGGGSANVGVYPNGEVVLENFNV